MPNSQQTRFERWLRDLEFNRSVFNDRVRFALADQLGLIPGWWLA